MKKLLVLLGLMLLLTGCTAMPKPTTSPTTTGSTEPTISLYDPTSDIEEDTNGAVRAYPMTGHDVQGFRFMGQDMILFTKDEHVELTTVHLLRGDTLRVVKSITLDIGLYPDDPHLRITQDSMGYYNEAENCVVILDSQLSEIRRIRLPDDVTDVPLLSSDLALLYYASGNELRELDLSTGISRLIKQHTCQSQGLIGLHFNDTLLEVYVTEEDGSGHVAFISTQDGHTEGLDGGLLQLDTNGTAYLLTRMDATVKEILVGTTESEPRLLCPQQTEVLSPALEINGVLAGGGSSLAFYDLASGKISSRIDLGSDVRITGASAAPGGNYIWIHGFDSVLNSGVVYRWDMVATEKEESQVFTSRRYSLEEPDADGLSRLQEKADAIGEKYGFKILLAKDVPQPEGYEFAVEYQTEAIENALTQLEAVLEKYPADFLAGLSTVSKNGVVNIGFVRSMQDVAGTSVPDTMGLHYMLQGDHHVALTVSADMERDIHHQLCHVLDSRVYAVSKAFDLWDDLNPEGFTYLGTYRDYEASPDDPNLQAETRAFVDSYSMTFSKEDRARLFECAMMEGNEALFASPVMQAKLKQLSQGIREAYKWVKTEIELPWEQYITEEG